MNFLNYVIRNDIDEVFFIDNTIAHSELLHDWVIELEQMGIIVNVNIDDIYLDDNGISAKVIREINYKNNSYYEIEINNKKFNCKLLIKIHKKDESSSEVNST